MTDDPAVRLALHGHALALLPEGAVWWPAARTLFVADLHLGKAATFRAFGQPVPSGTTEANLARVSALIERHDAARLIFLGDLLHAAPAQRASLHEALARWRDAHAALDCVLVRGNHDRGAGDPPAAMRCTIVDEPWLAGDALLACHHPQRHAERLVLAGHVHPVVRLHGRARDSVRLPCFVLGAGLLILPAFGEFTGGTMRGLPDDALAYPIGAGRVWPAQPLAR